MQQPLSSAEYLRLEEKFWRRMAIMRAHRMDAPDYAPSGGAESIAIQGVPTPLHPEVRIRPWS